MPKTAMLDRAPDIDSTRFYDQFLYQSVYSRPHLNIPKPSHTASTMASSGDLPPEDAAQETLEDGVHHLTESAELCLLKNFYGGLLLSAGGLLALVLATGFPHYSENNPDLTRLLQASTFPLGLVIVYFVGAELYVPIQRSTAQD
jgi:hypothetical protein